MKTATRVARPKGTTKSGKPRKPPTEAQLAARFQPTNPETGEKDERINRDGRPIQPRSQKELENLLDEVFDEMVDLLAADGQGMDPAHAKAKVTRLKRALIRAADSNNPFVLLGLMDRRFGKLKEKIEHSGSLAFRSWKEFIQYDGDPDEATEGELVGDDHALPSGKRR